MENGSAHHLETLETGDGSLTLRSARFGATYHAVQGAEAESRHVFIAQGLLPLLEQGSAEPLNLLEIGFGTGLNALLTWKEAERAGRSVHYHAVELYPVPAEVVDQLNAGRSYEPEQQPVFRRMHEQAWDSDCQLSPYVRLWKYQQAIEEFTSDLRFDLIYFDAFSPGEQPELWTEPVFRNMYALLKANGRLVTYCAQGQMKRNMKAAGFRVKALKGFAAKREMTVAFRD